MTTPQERLRALTDILERRILVLDGAMGTMLQQRDLTAADFGGPALEGCNENLSARGPTWCSPSTARTSTAGSDIIETNSFGCTPLVWHEYGLRDDARELNFTAAQLARQAADEFSTPAKPRFVAGSMGPTTKAITVTGGVTFPRTGRDLLRARRRDCSTAASTFCWSKPARTRATSKRRWWPSNACAPRRGTPIPIDGLGHHRDDRHHARRPDRRRLLRLRRARRPALHRPQLRHRSGVHDGPLRTISEMAPTRVSCYPNAGLPDERASTWRRPTSVAAQLERFVDNGWLNMVGGCCGTTDAHIRAIAQMAEGKRPRPIPRAVASRLLLGHRPGGGRREQPPADRGRAHQRHRLAALQEHGGRREVGGSHRNRAPAGEERRAHRGRLPAKHRPRRDGRHPAVLRQADSQDQSAGHDRYHRSARRWSWR